MCGIVGIAALGSGAPPPTRSLITRMCGTIVHRGPDEDGYFVEDPVALGMRRLSIIDVIGGSQPIGNEDGSVVVVFNGEIYNYRELRADLRSRGHHFRTHSDTEAIVHGYEEFGADVAKHLNGMFAYAVFDRRRNCVSIARDHVGVKPLYYAEVNGYLLWASEPKALLASGLIDRQLDLDALQQFLCWEYVPAPQTLFAGIRKLEPGCRIDVDLSRACVSHRRYWDVPLLATKPSHSEQEWLDILDETITRSVQRQLVSDVPVGAFLSGGVDSSLIVAKMGGAKTFSIGFDDPSYNELEFSTLAAEHLGVDHRTRVVRPEVVDYFEQLMYFMDDPIGDFSIFPTYLISKLARADVKVILSGDGGDELFGGYETYVAQRMATTFGRIPSVVRNGVVKPLLGLVPPSSEKKGLRNKAKRFVEGMQQGPDVGHARWRLFSNAEQNSRLLKPHGATNLDPLRHVSSLFQEAAGYSDLDRCLYVDTKSYLSDNILTKVDRMSMAVSLEARVPFLDPDVIALAFSMPDELKLAGRHTKVALKKVAARYVPNKCVYRPKEGFSIPIKQWLGGQFRPLLEDLLGRRKIEQGGTFNADYVEQLKSEHLANRANHSHILWSLMVVQAWRERWLDTSPSHLTAMSVRHA